MQFLKYETTGEVSNRPHCLRQSCVYFDHRLNVDRTMGCAIGDMHNLRIFFYIAIPLLSFLAILITVTALTSGPPKPKHLYSGPPEFNPAGYPSPET
jgi:hypothetical protein